MSDLSLRPIDASEFPEFHRSLLDTFGDDVHEDSREIDRRLLDPARSLAAFDRQRVVATAVHCARTLTVPGGLLPIAAVTAVSVSPTHRRRGLLTAMMRRQLTDLHEQGGESVAALWASESAIYGRFGYGCATARVGLRGRTKALGFRPDVSTGDGRVVLVGAEAARPHLGAVHDRVRARTPGWLDRSDVWWDERLFDPDRYREGASAFRFALHERADGEVDGYAVYRLKHDRDEFGRASAVQVHDMAADDPVGYAAVWRFLLDLDLFEVVDNPFVAPDEPLPHMVADARAVRLTSEDGLYVRVVDVGAGLAARRYATDVDVVLEVDDPFCPWNTGRWRLAAGPAGATCEQTGDPADLALGVEALGAAYLGGTALTTLAAAGRVTELTRGALVAGSRAFAADRAPWCPEVF